MLEAVAREPLVKTHQAGKGLSGCCGDCELWSLAVAVLVVSKSIQQPKPCSIVTQLHDIILLPILVGAGWLALGLSFINHPSF
jgi:hypothetical protein